jgi:hypothetical protein
MKKILGHILLCFICQNLIGQELDYAVFTANKFYFEPQKNKLDNNYIKVYDLDYNAIPYITWNPISFDCFSFNSWQLLGNEKILAIECSKIRRTKIEMKSFVLSTQDSIKQVHQDAIDKNNYQQKYPETWFFEYNSDKLYQQLKLNNLFSVTPCMDWQQMYRHHNYFSDWRNLRQYFYFFEKNDLTDFDFWYHPHNNEYHFYQRTNRNFMLWRYTGGTKKDTAFSDWHLEHFYASDSTCAIPALKEMPGWMGRLLLPDTTHFLPCTITDTAFFRGHNKAIQQGNQHWLINTSHGAIYYLADYGVVKVAQVENFRDYPEAILQQRLFVEDRDRGELVFFSKLIRTDREAPLPKYRSLLTPREVTQRFGALATLPKTKNRK